MEPLENEIQKEVEADTNPSPSGDGFHWKRFLLDLLETLALAVLLFFGINMVSARVRVDGESMMPTLQNGEFILVSKLSYQFKPVEQGDIIVFHFPSDPTQELIKRVIGLPGDFIQIGNGVVRVNGVSLSEPYIAASPGYDGEWNVPEGQLFVLGDNRNDSSDSHSWGYLPIEKIVGKAVMIYWPPNVWKMIQHTEMQTTQ